MAWLQGDEEIGEGSSMVEVGRGVLVADADNVGRDGMVEVACICGSGVINLAASAVCATDVMIWLVFSCLV